MPADARQHAANRVGKGLLAGIGPGRTAQQQSGLADLGTVEEPLAAAQHVGDAGVGKRLLIHLGLRVDPEQDRDLGGRRTSVQQGPALDGHIRGLGRLVVVLGERRRCTVGTLARQPHGRPAGATDQLVRQLDDLWRRPVVAVQAHLDGLGIPRPEVEQITGRRAGEGVDGLVRIAHDAKVVATAEPRVEQPLLQRRDVLVLVDDEVPVPRAQLLGDVAVLLDRARHDE